MYFKLNGLKTPLCKSPLLNELLFKKKQLEKPGSHNQQLMQFLDYLLFSFIKKEKILVIRSFFTKLLEVSKGVKGAILRMNFRFFRNNMRGILYVARFGFILCNLTGGEVAKKVLEVSKVYKRDKRGDGTLTFIGKQVKHNVKKILRYFDCQRIELIISTYFRRYCFFKLVRRYVFRRLKHKVFLRIPRGHNSMESAKRWRRRRR